MALKSDLESVVDGIISRTWNLRDGLVVPTTADVVQAGGGVRLKATILYADMADSTILAASYDRRVAAKVYKSFLACASQVITRSGGKIRSFDGDRVMGVFLGKTPNTDAAVCALKLKWAIDNIVRPRLEKAYSNLKDGDYKISHSVGIDVSDVLVVRGGMRDSNDLLWIGRAPNIAAKLSSRRGEFRSFVTSDVYNKLADTAKNSDGKDIWVAEDWKAPGGVTKIYKSRWGQPIS